MALKSPVDFTKKLHSWSPLNSKSLRDTAPLNDSIVKVKVRLAHMDSSDGDITDNDREDSSDLLINHVVAPPALATSFKGSNFNEKHNKAT